jgi:alpha-amylase
MKKNTLILFSIILVFSNALFAKKVKFSVDMTGREINVTGIHIAGDFQTAAGFAGGDWNPATTEMLREDTTTQIYSVVVNIPAFRKYEYKFVNGVEGYEVEFIPEESRVGYDFVDNRWVYVDSLANDIMEIGAIKFEANAPEGLTLVRFKVNLINQAAISSQGVHVAGNFQGWDPKKTRLYSFGNSVYEIINYVKTGTYEYKFYNGNAATTTEIIPDSCAINKNRSKAITDHIVLETVCFSKCDNVCEAVVMSSSNEIAPTQRQLSPNPMSEYSILKLDEGIFTLTLSDMTGKMLRNYQKIQGNTSLRIEKETLPQGVYLLTILNTTTQERAWSKLMVDF